MGRLFVGEVYHCIRCKVNYDFDDVKNNWRCPKCNSHISIKASTSEGDYNINRKKPNEIKPSQLVIHGTKNLIYEVLAVNTKDDNIFAIALAKFGVVYYQKNDWVSYVDGGWHY